MMKVNWGTGLVIVMMIFISFILYMVITMSINKKFSHDLVTEEYYKKEMAYQEEIDAAMNTNELKDTIIQSRTQEGIVLKFPKGLEYHEIKGTVFLYRPSNKQLDFDFPIEFSGSNLLIPDNHLLDGRWNITIDWKYKGERYLYKKAIHY